jgi:hypothetical protein
MVLPEATGLGASEHPLKRTKRMKSRGLTAIFIIVAETMFLSVAFDA